MRIISVTEIGVFKRCRRLWHYQYKEQLSPLVEAPHFFIGRMVHQGIAEWTKNPEINIEETWATILHNELEYYKERYTEVVGSRPSQLEIEFMMASALLPHNMLMNYVAHYKRPLPPNFILLEPEQSCLVDVPGLTDVQLEMTLDGLVYDEQANRFYILEHKTYEARPRIEVLENNEQFTGYTWGLSKLFPDYNIGGVLYNGLWKRAQPPRGKTISDLFFRNLLLKSEEELEDYEANLQLVAAEMVGQPAIYPNRTWQGCWDDSSFDKLCQAQSKGDDVDDVKFAYYGKRDKARWEYVGEE